MNTKHEHRVAVETVRELIGTVADFPAPGIDFKDVSTLLEGHPDLFAWIIDRMAEPYHASPPDFIVCIESWGYVFGVPLAMALGSRIVLARQTGKLPRQTIAEPYRMGYADGKSLEIHRGAIAPSSRVVIVDDVLATGGTVRAACRLVAKAGALVAGISCMGELAYLGAREGFEALGVPVHSVIQWEEGTQICGRF